MSDCNEGDSETVNEANARKAEEARKLAKQKARVELLYQIDRLSSLSYNSAERQKDYENAQRACSAKHQEVMRLVEELEKLP